MARFRQQQERLKLSSKTVDELKIKIFDNASPIIGPEPPRVLFIGESGAGKSSFISSIISTFNGTITMTSTIGSRVGHEVNNSRRFFEYRIHEKDAAGRTLNLILCDSRGVSKDGQLGISKSVIPLLIEGRFRHKDKIPDDFDPTTDSAISQRESIEPSCVVFLEKAVRIGDADDSIKDKLDLARDLVREKGIPSCLVITHIDEVEPNLKNVLRSKKIEKLIKERAGEAGVTPNRVFVVKNYTDESCTHVENDVLILRTVVGIVSDVKQRLRDNHGTECFENPPALPVTSNNHTDKDTTSISSKQSTQYEVMSESSGKTKRTSIISEKESQPRRAMSVRSSSNASRHLRPNRQMDERQLPSRNETFRSTHQRVQQGQMLRNSDFDFHIPDEHSSDDNS